MPKAMMIIFLQLWVIEYSNPPHNGAKGAHPHRPPESRCHRTDKTVVRLGYTNLGFVRSFRCPRLVEYPGYVHLHAPDNPETLRLHIFLVLN